MLIHPTVAFHTDALLSLQTLTIHHRGGTSCLKGSAMTLLSAVRLGALQLHNRIVMAPMTRNRATPDGLVGPLTSQYYTQRASAGLIVTEATNISADAVGYRGTPGIWTDAQIEAWKAVTSAVHTEGGLIVMQLWHTGRVGHSEVRGGHLPVAPSAIAIAHQQHFTPTGPKPFEVPRALTTDEITATVRDYATAGRNAQAAGFDGVELHGAFGYLPNQFLVTSTNQRTDQYGGSVANRCRFVVEVMEQLVHVWGEGRVGIRLSPTMTYNDMADADPLETFSHLIDRLNPLPLAYLHLMRAVPDPQRFPSWPRDTVATFAPRFRGPVIVNGGYGRTEAESAVEAGAVQAVSFGRPFVSNPDLVERLSRDAALTPADASTFYRGGPTGYIDYPTLADAQPTEPTAG